jgi:tetratricopeptide (TPR) repeat protein
VIPVQQAGKVFRVFVSSTFSDLKAERDALQEKVFPRLRTLCEENRSSFQAIDLRWGVGKESSLDQKTMKICLDELARCQKMSPKPNFIVLLGDRYGWRPLPYEIEATEFEKVINYVDKEENQVLIHEWYKRDDNAMPPVYLLQPVKEDEKEEWDKEEKILHAALLDGAREAGLAPLALFKYESSATEQEIEAGALSVEDADDHVFCFFRNIAGLSLDEVSGKYDGSAHDFVDMDEDGNADEEARRMLDDQKGRLKDKLRGNVFEYDAAWQGDGGKHPVTRDHLDKLCDDIYASLSRIIEEEVQKLESIDPLEEEIGIHEKVASEHRRFFTGRVKILDALSRYTGSDNASPLAIYGEGGMGKTALVSKAIEQAKEEHGEASIIYRFIGQTPESSDIAKLLESICAQVRRDYGKEELSSPESSERSYDKLIAEFRTCLTFSTDEKPLILFIDSLDQLSSSNNPQSLNWFPYHLSDNTKVIISTRRGEMLDRLNELIPDENLVELETMPLQEGEELLDKWLKDAGRRLEESQKKVVLSGFKKSENPLYLKLAFEEARLWASYTTDIALNPSVEGIIENLYGRLSVEKNHGKLLTSRSLGYIAASRYGLSEEELIDILSLDGEVMDDFQKRSPDSPEVTTLPFIVWSRLYEDLKPYLVRKSAQGTSVITFYHRELGDVVKEKYLNNGDGRERHIFLADYFSKKELSVRKTSELPWQLSEAKDWKRLYDLLSDVPFFSSIWDQDEYDAKKYWASLEEHDYQKVKAYKPVIDKPKKFPEYTWKIATLLQVTGSPGESKSLWEYHNKRYQETGDQANIAVSLHNQALILKDQGDLEGAMKLHKEEERIFRELGNDYGLANSLGFQAVILNDQGDLEGAMKLHKEEERICRELGDPEGLSRSLGNQALILRAQGDLEGAMKLHKEAEKICRELGNLDDLQASLGNQANILSSEGDHEGAMKLHKEEEKICRALGDPKSLSISLMNQAIIIYGQGKKEEALDYGEEALRIAKSAGYIQLAEQIKNNVDVIRGSIK